MHKLLVQKSIKISAARQLCFATKVHTTVPLSYPCSVPLSKFEFYITGSYEAICFWFNCRKLLSSFLLLLAIQMSVNQMKHAILLDLGCHASREKFHKSIYNETLLAVGFFLPNMSKWTKYISGGRNIFRTKWIKCRFAFFCHFQNFSRILRWP